MEDAECWGDLLPAPGLPWLAVPGEQVRVGVLAVLVLAEVFGAAEVPGSLYTRSVDYLGGGSNVSNNTRSNTKSNTRSNQRSNTSSTIMRNKRSNK